MLNENGKPIRLNRRDFLRTAPIGGLAGLLAACTPRAIRAITQYSPTPIGSPNNLQTKDVVTPTPTDIIPALRSKHVTRGIDGKLSYVTDINGNRIRSSYEIVVPPATDSDWNALNSRLGNGSTITWDGVNINGSIAGVEGLYFNKKGEVGLDLGNNAEVFHLDNIKTQTIDGKPTILVAGYAWNGETKKWDIFNPGFPMESPKDQLGWFTQYDIATGNWLRFHQRATADIDMKALFTNAYRIGGWGGTEFNQNWGKDGFYHAMRLDWWLKDDKEMENAQNLGIKKEKHPGRGGLSYGYLADSGVVVISLDLLNGDESITTLPLIIDDDYLWKEHRNDEFFTRAALAAGKEWDPSMVKVPPFAKLELNVPDTWLFWAMVEYYPDTSSIIPAYGKNDLKIIQEPAGIARRIAMIKYASDLEAPASLDMWGGYVKVNPQEALKIAN